MQEKNGNASERQAKDAFILEAIHIARLQLYGESYRHSDTAEIARREIYQKTGREVP